MELDNNMRLEDPGKLLQEYQSGQTPLSPDEKPKAGHRNVQPELAPPSYRDILRSNPLSNTRTLDYTEEAKEAGFGRSKYDTDFYPGMDLEHSRAVEQSGFSKIGTGLVKGGITAATTAVNTTLGTVFGLGSSLYSLADSTEGNSKGFMDVVDAGVNNWLSNQLVKIQNWAEEQFPNYRTEEERSEQYQKEWWKHMGTANFIGDSILKNFGFTVGAMAGGMAWSKLIGAGLSKQLANNIMKGAIAAAEGDSEAAAAMRAAAEAVKKGTAKEAQAALARAGEAVARGTAVGIDADALVLNIENAAKAINKYGAKLQLYGAAVGAMGEGTVEGIMAKNEFLDNYNRNWEEQYSREYNNIERDILESGNTDWVSIDTYELPDGSLQKERVLTPEGLGELYKRQQETTAKYQAAKEYAEEQGDRLSSTTFLLNLPILTASNSIQFGRMLSGGWQTSRNAAGEGIKGGLKKIANNVLQGNYRAAGTVAGRTALGALKVAGSESFEEMAQGTVSSGAKEVASRNLASFNNDGYDAQAVDSVREWFSAMATGGSEYLNDVKNWQEGAIGALTGLFGIPGRRWQGGIIGEYRDAKERIETDRATAEALNRIVNSKEFQDRWHGYIRHLKYDNDMEKAVKNDDEYAWHTADDNQLISDVIMFADANRLQDLNEIVSEYGKMSVADATQLKEAMKSDTAKENDWVRNASPEEIVDKVKKQADKMKVTIDQYKRFYDAMKSRSPINTSPELIKEMVFTAQEIKAYENRFLTMFGETMTAIEPLIEIQSVFNKDGKVIEDKEEQKRRFEEIKRSYESIFSMMGLPIKIPKVMRDETQKVLDFMETFAEGDDQLVKKIQDMRKLSNSRNVFYEKLITLHEPKGQKDHEAQAITPQKIEEKAADQMNAIETEELTTMDAVRQKYLSKNAKDRIEFLKTLDATSAKNPSVKNFLDIKNLVDGFSDYMATNAEHPIPEAVMKKFADDFLRKASSVEDVKNLPDSIFTPYEEYAEKAKSPFVSPSQAGYARQKQEIREEMQKYLGLDSSTKTRNTINPKPASAPVRTNDDIPTGLDASQPGSTTPKPQAVAQTSAKEEKKEKTSTVQPQTGTGEVTPISEELGQTPMAESVSKDEIAEEAYTVETEPVVPGEEKEIDGQKPYLHQSVPEVDSEQAKIARTSVDGRKTADLSDFVLKHPEYADTWNALSDAGAFAYTAMQLSVGDEIEFIIDPSFPKYEDRHQILMATRNDGELQILTPLSRKNAEYLGLRDLKDEIEKEYRDFIDVHPNDVFVFSKKSRVWAKRAGQIEYDFSDDKERGIQNISDYSETAPIIFINRNGDAQVVRGEADAMDKIASGAFDASFRSQRRGAIYYLVDNGTGSYIPVRLNVEHFKPENAGSDNPMFVRVRTLLSSIAGQTDNLTKDNVDYEKENQKLRGKMEQLVKLLDLHDLYLEFGNYENIGPAMKIVTWTENEDGTREEKHDYRRPEQMSDDWMINFVAEKNASFQVRQDEDGKMNNLDEYIENDILTSNAVKLRAKGVDFYVDPWDTDSQTFKPMISEQVAARDVKKDTKVIEHPIAVESEDLGDSTDDEDISWADDDYDDSNARKNNPVQKTNPTSAQEEELHPITTMDKLDAEVRRALLDSGWTEEEFNNAEQEVKERAVECAGAML